MVMYEICDCREIVHMLIIIWLTAQVSHMHDPCPPKKSGAAVETDDDDTSTDSEEMPGLEYPDAADDVPDLLPFDDCDLRQKAADSLAVLQAELMKDPTPPVKVLAIYGDEYDRFIRLARHARQLQHSARDVRPQQRLTYWAIDVSFRLRARPVCNICETHGCSCGMPVVDPQKGESFRYMYGCNQTDGEAIERNWAHLNLPAHTENQMRPGSRRDALNDFVRAKL
ncbi:hypothetical protein C8R43DRAFT_963587 [Mycena crocata]|nr:hypothetical protein C8R43DRAFT_963587 [Mycena crocata]